MKFSGKTYDDIKSDSKTKLCFHFRHYVFLNIFLGLRRGFFLNETSVLVFLKLERASEKLVGKSLGKGYDASYVSIFAQLRHVRQSFGPRTAILC